MRAALLLLVITAGALIAATDGKQPSVPQRLSDTGFQETDKLPFVPQYPLWSDGAAKSRWIHLPEGTTIDVSDPDAWRFPVGTKFWKQFSWNGRKIETRFIWKTGPATWVFAAYQWNEDQTDAVLVPETGVRNVVEVAPGKRHSIPGIEDCNTCHRSGPSIVLGFNALQLSDDRDPLAPNAEPLVPGTLTLRTLLDEDRLRPRRTDWVTDPPRIRAKDPEARAALGYLSANCGACHNDRGPLARLGIRLLHDETAAKDAPEPGQASTIEAHSSEYFIPGIAAEESRIVTPGDPERSSLFVRMRSRRPSSQMPPLGTVVPDAEALYIIRRWLEGLSGHGARG